MSPPPRSDTRRRVVLARSGSTARFRSAPRPSMRGWSHLAAAIVALPAAAIWTAAAPTGYPRVAVAAFAWGVALMFTASALLHLRRWSEATTERLVRVDHSGIYLAIGGTGVALGLLGFDGWPRIVLVAIAGVGVLAGIAVEWLPFAPPHGLSNGIYLSLGWTPVVLTPWLIATSGWGTFGWLLLGGVLYTVGATIVGMRRPDPFPGRFGYHELFHLLVILAVAAHARMIAELVGRHG